MEPKFCRIPECRIELTPETCNMNNLRRGVYLCRKCDNANQKRKREANKEHYRQWRKDYTEKNRSKINASNKRYYLENHEACKTDRREYSKTVDAKIGKRNQLLRLKAEVFTHYCGGEIKCQCCDFDDIRALSIDHINNDGAEHRRSLDDKVIITGFKFYRWLRSNNYPLGFQVLCMNCQFIKRFEAYEKKLGVIFVKEEAKVIAA